METTSTFFIPGRLPSYNEIQNLSRGKFGKYAVNKKKQDVQKRIVQAIQDGQVPAYASADFTFIWYEPNRKRDPDNIISAKKFIFDALQAAGVIENDGWSHVCSIMDQWQVVPDNVGVWVDIMGELA